MRRKSLYGYGLAILSIGLALWGHHLLNEYSGENLSPFILFYPAVMLSAWYGGLGPGLLATSLGLVLGYYLFIPPHHALFVFGVGDFLHLILFLFISLTINLLTENLHRSLKRHHQTAHDLRQSQEKFNLALESAKMGYWAWDLKTNEVSWSDNLAFLQGLGAGTLSGTLEAFLSCIHPDDRNFVQQSILQSIEKKAGYSMEFRTRWPDGSIHWIGGRGQIYYDERGKPERLVGFGVDINERKNAEEALKFAYEEMEKRVKERTAELAKINEALEEEILERKKVEKEVLEISQKEQRRLGAQIHDDLCQNLTGITMLTKVLTQKLERRGTEEARDLRQICVLLDQSITQAREMARGFFPVELQADSLMIALRDLASRAETVFHVQCRFLCPQPIFIEDSNLATHLYRITQEAVHNAIKHGQAKQIEIRLMQNDGKMSLAVHDDGKGLHPGLKTGSGIGLQIMKYRARMIDAVLEIQGDPSQGTTLLCSFLYSAEKTAPSLDKENNAEAS
jgi:PAS domain S-box-containing protein